MEAGYGGRVKEDQLPTLPALRTFGNIAAEYIATETMTAACEWAPFLLAHYKNALGEAAEGDEVKLARRLLCTIKRKGITDLRANEALRFLDGNGLKKAELEPALDLLVEGEWLRELPAPDGYRTGRPSSQRYAVNPAALDVTGYTFSSHPKS